MVGFKGLKKNIKLGMSTPLKRLKEDWEINKIFGLNTGIPNVLTAYPIRLRIDCASVTNFHNTNTYSLIININNNPEFSHSHSIKWGINHTDYKSEWIIFQFKIFLSNRFLSTVWRFWMFF
ncbi:hypothetical protein DLD82_17875 [Methanospirillum stamsii]|uniref:Uncharacterized protein n=1 Tax=Methanospirillum stamsii TaxID=1277351 RepID=A0A2V2MYV8_9EURY|nr:hypothetical protein DLD82_17875 [Methanospirillum stamsii]